MRIPAALSLLTLVLFAMNRYNWALMISRVDTVDTELQKERRAARRAEKCEVHFQFKLVSQDGEWAGKVTYITRQRTELP